MKILALMFISVLVMAGCSKDGGNSDQVASKSAVEADNTGKNVRDRDDATKTPFDQGENEADRTITQNVRKSIVDDDKLSTNAQNVKIITNGGQVTLRGPVKSETEKTEIEAKAKQVAGVKNVENQLEVTN
ncbi:MAG: BON domain-containing protein [Candidatus Binatia bacterium]